MGRTALALSLVLALSFSAVAVTQLVSLVEGNPYDGQYVGAESPSVKVNPPEVSVFSPKNDTIHNSRDVLLSFNVSTEGFKTISLGTLHFISGVNVEKVYFTADWLQNETIIYDIHQGLPNVDLEKLSLYLTNIPDGNHIINVYAVASGSEYFPRVWYDYYVTGVSEVNFVVDATPPKVTVLSFENRKYQSSDLPLTFTVNESVSQMSYSLDGEEAVIVAGNTTLANLPFGEHNVTVCATDIVGNIGVSETIYFSIEEPPKPFPTTMIIAPAASVTVLGMGLTVYLKKRKH